VKDCDFKGVDIRKLDLFPSFLQKEGLLFITANRMYIDSDGVFLAEVSFDRPSRFSTQWRSSSPAWSMTV